MDTSAIPPSWLDAWTAWSPILIAALVVATIVVRVLLPLAKAFASWAQGTSATWDDNVARKLVDGLTWAVAFSDLVLSWLPHVSVLGRKAKPSTKKTPPALMVVCILLACGVVFSACSSGPQLPIATTPIVVSCTWNFRANDHSPPEGGATAHLPGGTDVRTGAGVIIADNDCSIDRSSATSDQDTTGNDNRGARVDARASGSLSATGATP